MNREKFIQTTLEYTRTFLLTLLVSLILAIGLLKLIQYNVYKDLTKQKPEETAIDAASIGILIEKNEYLETQRPDSYKINLKLGELYELKNDYKNAELNYQKAILKAPYNQFKPKYRLALLYAKLNLLDSAQSIMDNIQERPDKKLITYKADVYKQIADKYYNNGDYENAVEKYQKSLSYWKILKNEEEIKYAENSLASSYVYLAENDLDVMKPDEAINALKMALTLVDAPILKYKLALLLMNENPELAYQYINEVFHKQPDLINYDRTCQFISKLADESEAQGDIAQADLYRYKIKELKDYFKINILSIDDIAIEDAYGEIILKRFTKKYKINLEFRLKNISKSEIDSLFLNVVFRDEKGIIDTYSEQVVDKNSILFTGFYSPTISIKSYKKQTNDDKSPKVITADIYISKTEKAHKLLLTTFELKEIIKPKQQNKFLEALTILYLRIMSKLPAFLF